MSDNVSSRHLLELINNNTSSNLAQPNQRLLLDGEDKPLEYVLADRQDAEDYTQLLLNILSDNFHPSDYTTNAHTRNGSEPYGIIAESYNKDFHGSNRILLCRYSLRKLSDVISSLKVRPSSAKATMASTFYPDGILIESCQVLSNILQTDTGDSFTQSACLR
jgi:hypothetical protein